MFETTVMGRFHSLPVKTRRLHITGITCSNRRYLFFYYLIGNKSCYVTKTMCQSCGGIKTVNTLRCKQIQITDHDADVNRL